MRMQLPINILLVSILLVHFYVNIDTLKLYTSTYVPDRPNDSLAHNIHTVENDNTHIMAYVHIIKRVKRNKRILPQSVAWFSNSRKLVITF